MCLYAYACTEMSVPQKHVRYHIHSKGSCFLSVPGAAIAYSLELGCDPRRTLHLNQTNLFVAVQRKDAEKVQAKEETDSKNCPCSNVHMNRGDIPSMSHPKQSLLNEMFEEFRCCWATIRIFYSESIMKVFRRIFNACFGVKHCLLHRALPVAR